MRSCFRGALAGMAEHLGSGLGDRVLALLSGTAGTDLSDRLLSSLYHHTAPQPQLLDQGIALCCRQRFTLPRFCDLVATTTPTAAPILRELLQEAASSRIAAAYLPADVMEWYPLLLGLDAPQSWWRYPDSLTEAALAGCLRWQILPCSPESRTLGITWGDRLFCAWAGILTSPEASLPMKVRSPLHSWDDGESSPIA